MEGRARKREGNGCAGARPGGGRTRGTRGGVCGVISPQLQTQVLLPPRTPEPGLPISRALPRRSAAAGGQVEGHAHLQQGLVSGLALSWRNSAGRGWGPETDTEGQGSRQDALQTGRVRGSEFSLLWGGARSLGLQKGISPVCGCGN